MLHNYIYMHICISYVYYVHMYTSIIYHLIPIFLVNG
jgi:hypothetical protein